MPQTHAPGTGGIGGGLRPRWWTELPLIVLVYAAYSAGRLLVRGDVADAVDNGLDILHVEKLLSLNAEHPLNRLFTDHSWIGVPADFWYASLHYLVTPAVLVWLWRSRAVHYRAARAWLMTSTMIGLIGFTLLPTCPPRLLSEGYGFVDTMAQYSDFGWWGGEASAPRGLGGMTNQYAAMPSLHVGWAIWCGVILWRHGRTPLVKTAAVAYPLITVIVVMGTANHYFLDAVAGAAVMGLGLLLARPVLRIADQVKAKAGLTFGAGRSSSEAAAGPGPASLVGSPSASSAPESSIVSGECQTSTGERIPRPRKRPDESGAEPSARPAEAGDSTPTAAR